MKSHRFWDRKSPNPLNLGLTLRAIVYDWPAAGMNHGAAAAGLSLALFTFLGVRAWLRRGTCDGVLILLPLMQATFTGTPMSLERIVLASFPAFLDLAEVLNTRRRFWIALAISLVLQVILLTAMCTGSSWGEQYSNISQAGLQLFSCGQAHPSRRPT